ncbi:MAG: PQQ-binding-like beta-propeller repeat protein [Verrucomicrobiota bacterium]
MVIFEILDPTIGVVPIVVNAGAALFSAFLAGAASFVALLFKPRELLRMCAKYPGRLLAVGSSIVLLTALIWLWPAPSAGGSGKRSINAQNSAQGNASVAITVDWTQVALARIAAEQMGGMQAPEPEIPVATQSEPFVFRGGAQRLGSLGGEIEGPLQLAWSYYPRWNNEGVEEEDRDAMILSSPAVWGDRVFAASCTLDPPESFGAVFALDAKTGQQIWTIDQADGEFFKGFFSSPAISGDGKYLLIGQGLHPDTNCRLICLEADTGRVHWTLRVPLHIESSPYIVGDTVYVGAGAIEDPVTRKPISHPGFVLAVRISDGKELWRMDVNDPESSPIVEDKRLYIGSGFNGNAVVSLDLPSVTDEVPTLAWRAESAYPITGAVTKDGEVIYVGGGNGDFVYRDPNPAGLVKALNASDGLELWTTNMADAVLGAVAASEYLICPVASGEVIALNRATGEPVWQSRISDSAPVLAAAAVTDREVFAVSQNGYLGRFNLQDGTLIERIYINAEERPGEQGLCISSPLVVGGRLFVGTETGGFRCYVGGGER